MVTTCRSGACTSPSNRVGLGSPLEACSVYGDLSCSVHTVKIFKCSTVNGMPTFVIEDHMSDWQICQICYSLEIVIIINITQALASPNESSYATFRPP